MKPNDGQPQGDIIDHIYDVALDPERYEQLLDVWEKRMAPLRRDADKGFSVIDPALEMHARRAVEFLDRLPEPKGNSLYARLAVEVAAAFCVGPNGLILDANKAAMDHFEISPGSNLAKLPLEPNFINELVAAISLAIGKSRVSSLLRFSALDGERAVIFHVAPMDGARAVNRSRSYERPNLAGRIV